jgi:Ni/Co efflux regulator RcnB
MWEHEMSRRVRFGLIAAGALALAATGASAEPQHGPAGGHAATGGGGAGGHPVSHSAPARSGPVTRPAPTNFEPHAGPSNYQRPPVPQAAMKRPATVDRAHYAHNFQASRSYHVGAYRRPNGWVAHRWAYGQILPRSYWAQEYFLADFWLFGLEVPPMGYEWVRDDDDAILVNIQTGEILEVEYGVFG